MRRPFAHCPTSTRGDRTHARTTHTPRHPWQYRSRKPIRASSASPATLPSSLPLLSHPTLRPLSPPNDPTLQTRDRILELQRERGRGRRDVQLGPVLVVDWRTVAVEYPE